MIKSLLLEIVSAVLYVGTDDKAAQTVSLNKWLAVSMSDICILEAGAVADEE